MSRFFYTDPRGRRSGPYSEDELKLLVNKGLLESDGLIELDGLAKPWSVSEIAWLRGELQDGTTAAPNVPPPPEPQMPPPPPDRWASAGPVAPPTTPPTTPEAAQVRIDPTVGLPTQSACSRAVYILLALLPPFIGIFGVHNIVAGYDARGVTALVLSLTTVLGIGCIAFPCTCVSVPIWLVLFTISLIEAVTVTVDAKGRPLS